MGANPLMDKDKTPNKQVLLEIFPDVYQNYANLIDLAQSYKKHWSYTKSSGWTLKVSDNKKALFYCIPGQNEYSISMAIRPQEQTILLQNPRLSSLHEKISNAKKYSEGFHILFLVMDESGAEQCNTFVEELMKLR